MTCLKCKADLKSPLYGSLCEDCWADQQPGLIWQERYTNREIKQGFHAGAESPRSAMIAETKPENA